LQIIVINIIESSLFFFKIALCVLGSHQLSLGILPWVFRIAAKQIIFSGEVIIDNELLVIPVSSLDILDVYFSWRDTFIGSPVVV
jgi:hypothetical protein